MTSENVVRQCDGCSRIREVRKENPFGGWKIEYVCSLYCYPARNFENGRNCRGKKGN